MKEINLSQVEKQLVMLAIQKQVQVNQQAEAIRQQGAAQFTADTKPVQDAHNITVPVNFDLRPDGVTMFISYHEEATGPSLVSDEGPIDPLS